MDYQENETDSQRKKRLRMLMDDIYTKKYKKEPLNIDLKCLKNRNGYPFTLGFYMVPSYNYFESIIENRGFEKLKNTKEKHRRTL